MSDVTLILDAINRGESQASEKLLPLVYEELRNLASADKAFDWFLAQLIKREAAAS